MNERELLLDCLRRLNRSGIIYYLTGSMASNYWGIPRTTHDLDFVVQLSDSAGSTIIREFSGDFYIDEEAVRAAQKPPYKFNAVDTRSALKVDFWQTGGPLTDCNQGGDDDHWELDPVGGGVAFRLAQLSRDRHHFRSAPEYQSALP